MCKLEATLVNHHKWQGYCYIDDSTVTSNCSQAQDYSIVQVVCATRPIAAPAATFASLVCCRVQYFYGNDVFEANGEMNCYLLNETEVSVTAASLVSQADTDAGQLAYGFYLSKTYAICLRRCDCVLTLPPPLRVAERRAKGTRIARAPG
jgi:hypothetical protein